MDERIKVLICLGSATAANCIPCFEHYFGKAKVAGLTSDEIQEAVDLASQVKKGAHMAIKNCINGLMGEKREFDLPCGEKQASKSCCG
jgi:alkylhydroperoxidase/carboxymuconolactone decarboxylase family protein YurZ